MSIILDFHLGHAGSPRLVVFWVYFAIDYSNCTKKETKRDNKRIFLWIVCIFHHSFATIMLVLVR